MLSINKNKCPQNHPCPLISLCQKKAIGQKGFGLPKIDNSKCIECMICAKNCRMGAVYKKN